MVSRLSLTVIMGCLIFSGWALAEPRLTVKVNKKSSLLGEPVLVEIKAADMAEPLSNINLDKLKQDFNILSISSNVQTQKLRSRTYKSETMVLTLYPLHTGKLFLPALSFHGSKSKATAIVITKSGKRAPQVIFKTAIDTPNPIVRQAVTLALQVYDDGSRQWTVPPELVAKGMYQHRLAETQSEKNVAGVRYTVHHYAWLLMPLREGRLTVAFPLLDAFKFGERLRYPVPSLQIVASPVPAYLPVHVPIGKLKVKLEPVPAEIALYRPVNLELSVSGAGISAEGLSKLLSAIHSDDSIRFYPLKVSSDINNLTTSATQLMHVILPFVPLRTGKITLPEINLSFYDPESARIQSVLMPGVEIVVFNPLWHSVRLVAFTLIVLAGLSVAGYQVFKYLWRIMQKRECLREIECARSADELSKCLMRFGVEASVQRHHTLQQWMLAMQEVYAVEDRFVSLVQALDKARYTDQDSNINITVFSAEFVNLLRLLARKKEGGRKAETNSLLMTLFHQPEQTRK